MSALEVVSLLATIQEPVIAQIVFEPETHLPSVLALITSMGTFSISTRRKLLVERELIFTKSAVSNLDSRF